MWFRLTILLLVLVSALPAGASASSDTARKRIPVDTVPPTVFLTAPAANATVTGTAVLSASASDNVAVVGVVFKVDGVKLGAEDTAAPFTASWNTTTSSDGTHQLTATARDLAGNSTTSQVLPAVVSNTVPPQPPADTTAPTVSLSSPAAGATVFGTLTVAASASDNVGVAGVSFLVDGLQVGLEATAAPFQVSWDSTSVADGTHTLTALARDAAGNVTVSAPRTVNVSNAAVPPSPPPVADAYVSTTGSDSAACTSAAPCQTFNRAYHLLAASGGTALVAAGSYPAQSIVAPYAAKTVTIKAAAADSVYVAGLSIGASHVHLVDISGTGTGQARADLGVCNTACSPALTDVQVINPHFRSAFIRSSNVTIRGGEVGGFDACQANAPEDGFRLWSGSTDVTPSNDVIDHVWIHDVTSGVGNTCQGTVHAGFHVDCMQNAGGANDLFSFLVFTGCPTSDVQMQPFAGAVIHDITFDHVYFGKTACCNVIVLGDTVSNTLCSTLHITNSVLFGTPNKGACASLDLQANTTCVTVDQAGCAVPAVPFAAAAASVAFVRKR